MASLSPSRRARAAEAAAIGEQQSPTVPLDASASELTVLVRNFILQMVLVAGAIIAMLGLPATSWLARIVVFLKADEVRPLIGLVASTIASGWILLRAFRKHRLAQVQSLLLPESVSKSPINPPAAVVAAAEAATVLIEQQGAPPAPLTETRGL